MVLVVVICSPVKSLLMRFSNLGLIAIVAVHPCCGSTNAVHEQSILTGEPSETVPSKLDVSIHPVLPARGGQAYIAEKIVPRFLEVLKDSAATADRVTVLALACQALPDVRGKSDVSAQVTELRDQALELLALRDRLQALSFAVQNGVSITYPPYMQFIRMCRRMGDQESFPAPPDTAGVDRVDERLTELLTIHPLLLAVRARVVEQASGLRRGMER